MIRVIKKVASYLIRLNKKFMMTLELPNSFVQFLIRPLKISNYIKNNKVRKLQLGSGTNRYDGWFNTDLYPRGGNAYLDVTSPLPFKDNTFDYIYSEHMIEHISFQDAEQLLRESYRILRRGGKLRIATPDLSHYVSLFGENKSPQQNEYIDWMHSNWINKAGIKYKNESFILNLAMHSWGHLFIFDFNTLNSVLSDIGFGEIKQFECQKSDDENLVNLENHGEVIGNIKMNHMETLVVQGTKL